MMDFIPTPESVTARYQQGVRFNNGINLYDTVKTNEDFFVGKQWEGVKNNGLPTPVFNFLKRVVLFSVANVSTDNLKLRANPMPSSGETNRRTLEALSSILNDQFLSLFEFNKMGAVIREFCRNAAVDGDGCTYSWFDPYEETGQAAKGAIRTETLKNTQVIFGNPNSRDVQSQPYLIIERRMMVSQARKRARLYGADEADVESIVADDTEGENSDMDQLGGSKATVLVYLWKDDESGSVHSYECTKSVTLRGAQDLGIKLYPVTWMPWDFVHDCYHGQAMITGLIPNQIFVNKLFAMSMISLMTLAYPKIIFDKTKVAKWSNRVGAQIAVNGSVEGVAKIIDPASISPQISQFIELAISYTQKFLGATDVALGDTRPDNTSAIIALQRAAATPMELTKQALLQSIEDLGRIYIAFMGEYYGERYVEIPTPYGGEKVTISFDFSVLKSIPCSVKLDAGASSYWSEIAEMQTLDNLLMQNKISTVEYIKRLPTGQITDKDALIAALEGQQLANPALPQGGDGMAEDVLDAPPPLRGGAGYGALQRKINETGEMPRK